MSTCFVLTIINTHGEPPHVVVSTFGAYHSYAGALLGLATVTMLTCEKMEQAVGHDLIHFMDEVCTVRRLALASMPCGPMPHRRHARAAWKAVQGLLENWNPYLSQEAEITEVELRS